MLAFPSRMPAAKTPTPPKQIEMPKPLLTTTAAKAHLRVEHGFDDELIALFAEAAVDRTLQEIGLAGVLEREHSTETNVTTFGLAYPVAEIVAVEKKDYAGDWQAVPGEEWTLTGTRDELQVIELSAAAGHLSGSSYRVRWTAGLGDPAPAWFRVACLFLLGHYYENRSSVIVGQGVSAIELPMGFASLCNPHRRWFFA